METERPDGSRRKQRLASEYSPLPLTCQSQTSEQVWGGRGGLGAELLSNPAVNLALMAVGGRPPQDCLTSVQGRMASNTLIPVLTGVQSERAAAARPAC